MERNEREKLTLGILLNDDPRYIEATENCFDRLQPKYFTGKANGLIYDTMRSLHNAGKPANIFLLAERLKSLDVFKSDIDLENGLNQMKKEAFLCEESLETFCNAIIDDYISDNMASISSSDKPINERMKRMDELMNEYETNKRCLNSENTNVKSYIQGSLIDELEADKQIKDVSTVLTKLDCYLGSSEGKRGLLPERLYVLGAIPSLGKTTFIHQMADNMAAQGNAVLFFSLEQSKKELVCKSITREQYKLYGNSKSRKDGETLTTVNLLMKLGVKSESTQNAIKAYDKAAENLYIYEGNFNTTVDTITATVRRFKRKYRQTPVVIVDYLQILKPAEQSGGKYSKTKDIIDVVMTDLKVLARNEKIIVIVISSFGRDFYTQQATFKAFKESGSIEYSADKVMALQLQKLNETQDTKILDEEKAQPVRRIELVCLKNRGGAAYFSDYFDYIPKYEYFTEREKDK